MTISDCFVIVAILLAPLLAIQSQKYLENRKDKKRRRLEIFRTLMLTRATPLDPKNVEALNLIDIEFYKNKKIGDKRKLLLDSYANFPKDNKAKNFQSKLDAIVTKSNELQIELLLEISKSLNYDFDKVHLKREVYHPKGHTDAFFDQEIIRRSLVNVFLGKTPIPIKIINTGKEEQKKKKS